METELTKRKSCRIPGYDYSQNGAYFITICTKDREKYFGEIKDGKIYLMQVFYQMFFGMKYLNTESIWN